MTASLRHRTNLRTSTWAAALIAVSLTASACGGTDDTDAADTGFDPSGEATDSTAASTERSADAVDAESDFVVAEEEEAMEEAMEGDSDTSSDSADDAEEGFAPEAAPAEGEQGFFDEPDEAVEEDPAENTTFENVGVRPFVDTDVDPLSTFALDVDTASYSIARNTVAAGGWPDPDGIRVEEFVNAFSYDYSSPRDGLGVTAEGGPSPLDPSRVLLSVGVSAEQVADRDRPDANLTFVVDTSGSMREGDRLGMVQAALTELVENLSDDDRVAIVTFAGGSQVVLEPTRVDDRAEILDAIERLSAGGSTNLESGLDLGYGLADEMFDRDEINRVIVASDGVANAGLTDPDRLVRMIRDDADRGVNLLTVGVGLGNFNDVLLETLADDGDGFYAYVNTADEARTLFRDELVSTLLTVAKDAKIQVEFDDSTVAAYRLVGFENRAVRDSDFRNDDVDAGELGAGHQVTALYELELRGAVDGRDPLGTVMLRWEDPETGDVIENRLELTGGMLVQNWTDTSTDHRLAATVGMLAEVLRQSPYAVDLTLEQISTEVDRLADELDRRDVDELSDMVDRLR